MEEIEFQRAWTSKFHDSKSNEKGSEHVEEKGYVMLSIIIPQCIFFVSKVLGKIFATLNH